jgi:hypothetical protein
LSRGEPVTFCASQVRIDKDEFGADGLHWPHDLGRRVASLQKFPF